MADHNLSRVRNDRFDDRRNAQDRPKSRHALPGYEPWVLIKTKFRRRFVHNTNTGESLWRIPDRILPAVQEFDKRERDQKEQMQSAKWAEAQLRETQQQSKAPAINAAANAEIGRRRRSESLQREDEAALLAELAAQAEHDEEQDAMEAAKAVQPLQPVTHHAIYESDSEYEVVEVTDSEGEEDDAEDDQHGPDDGGVEDRQLDDSPVEFGEDDIAYQLAAMGEDYDLDPGEYGEDEGDWEEGAEGLPLDEAEAVNLFRSLLDDHGINPFTPWEKVISDEAEGSILNDDRFTALPTSRARKNAWDAWVKDKAAEIQRERAVTEKQDPRIPYLAFLHEKASTKLYWPEFKRKYKREAELNDRKLGDKDRERLYRDHVNRLKLPETTRKADLMTMLKSIPIQSLNRDTSLQALPQRIRSDLHYISLPAATRDAIIEAHVRKLPASPAS